MRYLFLLILLTSCAANMPVPNVKDTQYVVQNLEGQKQEQNLWCGVAAARMMMSYKTKSLPSQCEIVSRVTGRVCANQTILTEDALRVYGYAAIRRQPNYQYVVYSIKMGKPITIYYYNRAGSQDGSTHAVVAYWTFSRGGKDYIIVYDPWTDTSVTWDSSFMVGNMAWDAMIEFR